MLERLIFPNFFEILTVSGALAAWGLLCWLAAPAISQASPALHLLMPLHFFYEKDGRSMPPIELVQPTAMPG